MGEARPNSGSPVAGNSLARPVKAPHGRHLLATVQSQLGAAAQPGVVGARPIGGGTHSATVGTDRLKPCFMSVPPCVPGSTEVSIERCEGSVHELTLTASSATRPTRPSASRVGVVGLS